MKTKGYFLALFTVALAMGISSFVFHYEFQSHYLVLGIVLFIVSLFFNFKYAVRIDTSVNISFVPNYGLPLILLTNPFIHFVYIFLFEIVANLTDKTVKKEEQFWEIIYNASSLHILNTLSYLLFYSLFPQGFTFSIGFAVSIYVILLLSSVLSRLSVLYILMKENQVTEERNYLIYFFKQTLNNMLLSAPVYMILIYSFATEQYVMFAFALVLQVFIADTLQKSGESIKKEVELETYKRIAYKDPMTDCYNRRFLKEHASKLERHSEPAILVMVDLDDFKRFNDTYNHDVGDQVLEWFVQSVKKFLHSDEYIVRNGGEEFLLLLSTTANARVKERIEDIRSYISAEPVPVIYQGKVIQLNCTASFGVAAYNGQPDRSFEKVLLEADELLYKSKKEGKNRISAA